MIARDIEISLHSAKGRIATVLRNILQTQNASQQLQRAASSIVVGKGKCLRPLLAIEVGRLFGLTGNAMVRMAAALECAHCYSLVHDDLPAMDDSHMRRGQVTLHKMFDEATAILVGDGLLTLAFEILADPETCSDPAVRCSLIENISKAIGFNGMVAGQMLDLQAEGPGSRMSVSSVSEIYALKTGKLIQAAVDMGAIMGGATREERALLSRYAKDIGLAFQLVDDVLDIAEKQVVMGKVQGQDRDKHKATFAALCGVKGALSHAKKLCLRAKESLKIFGDRAHVLKDLADFIYERDR